MNKKIKIALIVFCGLIVFYFFSIYYLNHYYYIEEKIGDIQICNSDLRIVLYKTHEFDKSIPIYYQLYKGSSPLQNKEFLIGTSDFDININSFIPHCNDSIFTLSIYENIDIVLRLNINDFNSYVR